MGIFFKKFFGKKEKSKLLLEKKAASIEEWAEGIVIIACNVTYRQRDIEFINEFAETSIDEQIINRAINEIIMLRAAISTLLFLKYYQNHSKIRAKISVKILVFTKQLDELFNNTPELWRTRMRQYADALEDENPIESISNIIQFVLERTIDGWSCQEIRGLAGEPLKVTAKKWAYPSWDRSMRCVTFVEGFIEMFSRTLNNCPLA